MKHTIEELGEMTDTHHKGGFMLRQLPKGERLSSGKANWGCTLGDPDYGAKEIFGATPDAAVEEALNRAEKDSSRTPSVRIGGFF